MSTGSHEDMSRSHLPIPEIDRPRYIAYDAKDPESVFPAITQIRPPAGAPNVLIVLIDDVGYGASSAFGGPCNTPTAERLAANGLKYTRFHTTALCSPTRAALLSGRNHHTVNMGAITEMATSAPGQTSSRPNTCAPLAETLKLNGYSTAQFGKCHEVPVWETGPMGPYTHWPTPGGGFEHFYGFLAGESNQYYPTLYNGITPVEPPRTPEEGYTLNEDLADQAISYIRHQKGLASDRPFFVYYAPGATHAPHHVPQEWIDKYKGKFDHGWDKQREMTLAKQKELGVVAQDTVLTQRHDDIPGWDETADSLKPVLSRQMEVYAGFFEHTDYNVGRVVDVIEELGELDNTLIIYIIGDNGASAEGTAQGTSNEMISLNGFPSLETAEYLESIKDRLGGPEFHNHYSYAWAHAMNTPYQWTKQVASHFGGTRNGTIVHWPAGIEARGEVRNQFHHVIDIAATVLEAAKLPEPISVNGVQQKPYEGTSMVYSFDGADEPDRHTTQYFEMFGNRGLYHNGWTAVTKHRNPFDLSDGNQIPFDDDVWELYDTNTDWSQSNNLAKENPEMLAHLQRQWLIEAVKYNVLPLDDRGAARGIAELAGRPTLAKGDTQTFWEGAVGITESSVISFKNRSWAATAEVTVTEGVPANGVIWSVGGITGGVSMYALDGKLGYTYNFFGLEHFDALSTADIPSGTVQVRHEFTYDGKNHMTDLGMGGTASIYINGELAGSTRVERTVPGVFSAEETFDVGRDTGSPVSLLYPATKNAFNGRVRWVQIDTGEIDPNVHLIEQSIRLRVAAGTQ